MMRPLEKLILASAKKYHLSEEAKAALVTTSAKKWITETFPQSTRPETIYTVTYSRETLYIRTQNSALAASLALRRQDLLIYVRQENPRFALGAVIVIGRKK